MKRAIRSVHDLFVNSANSRMQAVFTLLGFTAVLILFSTGCIIDETISGDFQKGHLYNATDGTAACDFEGQSLLGEDLVFTVDDVNLGVIESGLSIPYYLEAGFHDVRVTWPATGKVVQPGATLEVIGVEWYYWYGCADGSHPDG